MNYKEFFYQYVPSCFQDVLINIEGKKLTKGGIRIHSLILLNNIKKEIG